MDDAKPYLEHRYVIISNVDYYFNYIPVEGTIIRYHVKGTLTLSRDINTQIPDEDQAIEWQFLLIANLMIQEEGEVQVIEFTLFSYFEKLFQD